MDKKDLAELTPEEKEKPVTWGELAEVAKMIGEEAIKLTERSDTEKNALDEVVEMMYRDERECARWYNEIREALMEE